MKKKYYFKLILTLLFTLFIFSQTYAQVRITEVNPSTDAVTIHNFNPRGSIDISSYQLCSLFNYGTLGGMTITSGSLNLISGADVTVACTASFVLNNTAADLGLYNSGSFGSTTAMEDFTQWGSGGNGRESVAVAKGIWSAGDFISVAAPYQYTGDGAQNGVTFWNTVLGIDDFENQIAFSIFPNPTASILNLQLSPSFVKGNVNVFDILGKQVLSKKNKLKHSGTNRCF